MHAKRPTTAAARHTRPGVLAADRPLVVPMELRISDLKLRGIVVLVVSKTKGITLVFKNDPLENIVISSTFDSVVSVRNYLQRVIEEQLRKLFQEDLPVMIHNLSLRYIEEKKEPPPTRTRRPATPRSVVTDPGPMYHHHHHHHHHDYFSVDGDDSRSLAPLTPPTPSPLSTCLPDYDFKSMSSYPPLSFSRSYYAESFFDDGASVSSYSNSSEPSTPFRYYTRSMYGRYPSMFTEYASMKYMHQHMHHWDDVYDQEDSTTECSSLTACSTPSCSLADFYANDVDAPWYVKEGPEIPSLMRESTTSYQVQFTENDVLLLPSENALAARLAHLTRLHQTLSPLLPTIAHSTCRSFPHAIRAKPGVSISSSRRQQRKVPKRRVIRLSGFNNNNNSNSIAQHSTR